MRQKAPNLPLPQACNFHACRGTCVRARFRETLRISPPSSAGAEVAYSPKWHVLVPPGCGGAHPGAAASFDNPQHRKVKEFPLKDGWESSYTKREFVVLRKASSASPRATETAGASTRPTCATHGLMMRFFQPLRPL